MKAKLFAAAVVAAISLAAPGQAQTVVKVNVVRHYDMPPDP